MTDLRVEVCERIAHPIEGVFDRLADIEGYNSWMSTKGIFSSCTKDTPGPVRHGSRYTDRTRIAVVRGEVSEIERPRRLVFHYRLEILGLRLMEGWPGYDLERDDDGATLVRHVARAELYGVFRMARLVIRRIAIRERTLTVDALKRSLESGVGSAGAPSRRR